MDKQTLAEAISTAKEEYARLCYESDYDEGSYLSGYIDALEWVLDFID